MPIGRNKETPSKEKMDIYYKIFKYYCLPSVVGQANKNFKWLILFDDLNTDKELILKFNGFIPIFITKFTSRQALFRDYILKIIKPETEYIITSRLDIDDTYHKHFVDLVQNAFIKNNKNRVLNIPCGCVRNIKTNKLGRVNWTFCNPFISLIEKSDNIKTVCRIKHRLMKSYYDVEQISCNEPMFIQNITGINVSNKMCGSRINNINFDNYNTYKEKLGVCI